MLLYDGKVGDIVIQPGSNDGGKSPANAIATVALDDLKPQMQRQMRQFEDGSHAYSERLAALVAFIPRSIYIDRAWPASLRMRLPSQLPQWWQTGPFGHKWAST